MEPIALNDRMNIISIRKRYCGEKKFTEIAKKFQYGCGIDRITLMDIDHDKSYINMVDGCIEKYLHCEYQISPDYTEMIVLCFYKPFKYLQLNINIDNMDEMNDPEKIGDYCNKFAIMDFEQKTENIEQQLLFALI